MKELISAVVTLLKSLKLPVQFYYGKAPREVVKPYITFTIESHEHDSSMDKLGDLATLSVSVWSANENIDEVVSIADDIMSKLDDAAVGFVNEDYNCVRIDRSGWSLLPVDDLGVEVGWRATVEWTIYYTHEND